MNSKTFGEIIKEQRIKMKLPLRVVALRTNIDQSTLSKIERNERKAPRNLIEPISKILDLKFKQLLRSYLSDKIAEEIINENDSIAILNIAKLKVLKSIKLE